MFHLDLIYGVKKNYLEFGAHSWTPKRCEHPFVLKNGIQVGVGIHLYFISGVRMVFGVPVGATVQFHSNFGVGVDAGIHQTSIIGCKMDACVHF